jgi:hypothetical protein
MMMVMIVVIVAAAAMLLIVVMMVMLMVVIVTAAAMLLVMVMVVVFMVVVVTAAAMLLIVVMVVVLMVVVVAAAAMLLVMVMVVMLMVVIVTAAAMLLIVVMVVMLMVVIVAAAAMLLVMVMMVMLLLQLCQLSCKGLLTRHGRQDLLTGQLAPRRGDNGCLCIMLPEHRNGGIQLRLRNQIRTGQNNGGRSLHLIVIELTEVLHIHLDLAGIHHRNGVAKGHILVGDLLNGTNHVGQLAHAGGLDDDPVGVILADDLLQRLTKIAHKGAANAAGIHLGNVDAGILQEAAVNADLTELILNQHQLLSGIGFLNHFLDQRGLTGTQKAGIHINFRHYKHLYFLRDRFFFF